MNSSKTTLIKEGSTQVFVFPSKKTNKGPGAKQPQPFYNPAMELNRDLSIVVSQWYVDKMSKCVDFVDGLAASGIRGIRLAREVDGEFTVTINDRDPSAFSLIEKNIKKAKIKNAIACNQDLNVLLSSHQFNGVDIDPFGSPVPFVDASLRSIRHNGLFSCTATDTATLCGVYPKVCLRRYSANSYPYFCRHEIGLRILLGYLCREAAKYDKGIQPILCYSTDYYYRVYVLIFNGTRYANESMKQYMCINPQEYDMCLHAQDQNIGPLWMGKFQKKDVIKKIRTMVFKKTLHTKHELWKLLSFLEEEADAPPLFYTTDSLASSLKLSPPTMNHVFQQVKRKGYDIVPTHFSPTGFKTKAPLNVITQIFRAKK